MSVFACFLSAPTGSTTNTGEINISESKLSTDHLSGERCYEIVEAHFAEMTRDR